MWSISQAEMKGSIKYFHHFEEWDRLMQHDILTAVKDSLEQLTLQNMVIMLVMTFFSILLLYVSTNSPMWLKRYGRRHRVTGLLLLCWLLLGFGLVFHGGFGDELEVWICYDLVLGILGIATAYTAASDFRVAHSGPHIRNKASGVLDEDATVTYSEMIEHVFYQILNLVQIAFLHTLSTGIFDIHARLKCDTFAGRDGISSFTDFLISDKAFGSTQGILRFVGGVLVTAPWLFRDKFPINKFQDNYNRGQDPWTFNAIMYRSKKYQYVFYKHWMLHGLNATMALPFMAAGFYFPMERGFSYSPFRQSFGQQRLVHLVNTDVFRMYWLCLNLSYVMEFFMQTLVKRKYMSQMMMMILQRILMTAATVTALAVVAHVHVIPAALSLLLMILRRKQELSNFVLVLLGSSLVHFLREYQSSSPVLTILKVGTCLCLIAAGILHAWKWWSAPRKPSQMMRESGDAEGDTEDDAEIRKAITEDVRTFILK